MEITAVFLKIEKKLHMKKDNYKVEDIAKITGLTMHEIEKI